MTAVIPFPMAVSADPAELERATLAAAFVYLTRQSIGIETRGLAALMAAQVCRPDGSSEAKATQWELEDRLSSEDQRRLFAAVIEGKGAEARDILLRHLEEMAIEQHEIEDAKLEEDEQGRLVYELR